MKCSILNDVLSPAPPEQLYHYTTQPGLVGIVKDREIWATHTQYLNDQQEYLHAVQMVRNEIEVMLNETSDGTAKRILTDMGNGIEGIESMNICVCSFSEVKDSLSQWRAYGGSSSGYAIGFHGSFLCEISHKHDFYLVRCMYTPSEQKALIRALLEEVLEENTARSNSAEMKFLPQGGNLCAYLHRYAPILKDLSFAEEREWRLISRPMSCTRERFDYRSGRSMIIPYYRLPLFADEVLFQISEVVVGPTPHPLQAIRSVTSLLVKMGLREAGGTFGTVPVSSSLVPYRNW